MRFPHKLSCCACMLLGSTLLAAESPRPIRIDPAKVAQLKRLEPLSPEKVRVFLDSGQLDNYQVELVVKHIDAQGILNLPATVVGAEDPPPMLARKALPPEHSTNAPRQSESSGAAPPEAPMEEPANPARTPNPAKAPWQFIPRTQAGGLDVMAYIRQLDQQRPAPLPEAVRLNLEVRLAGFRGASPSYREELKQALRAAVPGCNPLIAADFIDPIDLHDTVSLWKAVAWSENPRAAGYIAAAHQQAVHTANPVLIAYAKDVGGLILRRRQGREQPLQLWYESRDLRELILDLEKAIAQCSGVRATTYLMDVFAARYRDEEAPMRDSDRDKKRMVQASGGNKEAFNNGDPATWHCALPPIERAMIAERLVPHLRSEDGDLRDIARDGLLVVLGNGDKHLKDQLKNARKDWDSFGRWYHERREQLLGEAR